MSVWSPVPAVHQCHTPFNRSTGGLLSKSHQVILLYQRYDLVCFFFSNCVLPMLVANATFFCFQAHTQKEASSQFPWFHPLFHIWSLPVAYTSACGQSFTSSSYENRFWGVRCIFSTYELTGRYLQIFLWILFPVCPGKWFFTHCFSCFLFICNDSGNSGVCCLHPFSPVIHKLNFDSHFFKKSSVLANVCNADP